MVGALGAPYQQGTLTTRSKFYQLVYVCMCIVVSVEVSGAIVEPPLTYVSTCDSPEGDGQFRLSVPLHLKATPSQAQLSHLPSCLDVGNCELLVSAVENCGVSGTTNACREVVSCSNGSLTLHPELFETVSEFQCSTSPSPSAGRICDDIVVREEVWDQIAERKCNSSCVTETQNKTQLEDCKLMVLELRTNSLRTALKLRSALKSPSSLDLLERCLGGNSGTSMVQAIGPAGNWACQSRYHAL